ncbi:putative G-protein coupled receptor 19 [Dissostichus eleginoides]|uniref:G-protein coupled receptor 19 n=1 Tax=Dissostichus eleginoides TaxID=100907 RepID=A0AAD9CT12_DISEL|nr:putative G-protein coupled receptor 19 [Dissostichus eleginoides]KAK1906812.1 putative G-protein coupled receptor 19 [Dissostichus eleginoides]
MVLSSSNRVSPSLYSPYLTYQMSLNFSERENATTLPTTPLCSLEGNATAADELTPGEVAVLSLVFGLLWLVSILGNALVCLVIHRSRRTQSTTNYFVVSMACADLLMSLGWAPFILLQVRGVLTFISSFYWILR